MALYGESRDISMFRHVNRELMQNIISQQCAFYQIQLNETVFNMYGEASQEKYYNGPFLLYALIDMPDQTQPTDDMGVTFEWGPEFRFLRDDLTTGSLGYTNLTEDIVPQIGDIIFWEESYFEINAINEAQYFVGKNPETWPNGDTHGYSVSIVVDAHTTRQTPQGIKDIRRGGNNNSLAYKGY
jgi:hypothetical protein